MSLVHPYNRDKNVYKDEMNRRIMEVITLEYSNLEDRVNLKVLAFDGIKQRTSKKLMNCGIKRENIRLIENDVDTFEIHDRNGFRCTFGNAEEIFAKKADMCYDIIVLDAIGEAKSIFGLMRLLIKNGYTKRNTIFISTFVRRCIKTSYSSSFRSCKNMFSRWLNIKIVDLCDSLSYGAPRNKQSNMITYFWQIESNRIKF